MAHHHELTIITGASRGMGAALAQQLFKPGQLLLTLSRRATTLAPVTGAQHVDWQLDLAHSEAVAVQLHGWLMALEPRRFARLRIIHNAGVLSDLAPLSDNQVTSLVNALRVGLEAPMVLTAQFLRATASWAVPRQVLFISSGLGRHAMSGSASYCAAKAGLDHLARALALEEAAKPGGARVCSLAPGVIDTDMQVQLRSASPGAFSNQHRFESLHAQGQLMSPAQAAAKIVSYLDRPDFGSQPVADVRDAS